MIRITGGKNRSRKLVTSDTTLTKPTMDKVRAAVFNALGDDIRNKKVLDLFSGSGSYGFEALSRGASHVTFVEKDIHAIDVIKENSLTLKEENIKIIKADVITFLENNDESFDVIFVDPPYKLDVYEKVLSLLKLSPKAIIVLETERPLNISEMDYAKVKMYNYGLASIYILRK